MRDGPEGSRPPIRSPGYGGRRAEPFGPPPRLRPEVSIELQTRSGWPIYTVTTPSSAPERTVIYLHGGGWVNEIKSQHWQLAAHIAVEAQAAVIVPIYPLASTSRGRAHTVIPDMADLISAQIAQHGWVRIFLDNQAGGGVLNEHGA